MKLDRTQVSNVSTLISSLSAAVCRETKTALSLSPLAIGKDFVVGIRPVPARTYEPLSNSVRRKDDCKRNHHSRANDCDAHDFTPRR